LEGFAMTADRALQTLLRIIGGVSALAIVPVFMPRACMAACHEWLGLGPFPEGPIVEYLARSTSMFYAVWGCILWGLARDVRRYVRMVMAAGAAMAGCGVVLFVIDLRGGLPAWWIALEGPWVVLMGAVILTLAVRVKRLP
jgi:hypothetical protein